MSWVKNLSKIGSNLADQSKIIAKQATDRAKIIAKQASDQAKKVGTVIKQNPKSALTAAVVGTGGVVVSGVVIDKVVKGDNLGQALTGTFKDITEVAKTSANTAVSAVTEVATTGLGGVFNSVSELIPNIGAYLPIIGIVLLIIFGLYLKTMLRL